MHSLLPTCTPFEHESVRRIIARMRLQRTPFEGYPKPLKGGAALEGGLKRAKLKRGLIRLFLVTPRKPCTIAAVEREVCGDQGRAKTQSAAQFHWFQQTDQRAAKRIARCQVLQRVDLLGAPIWTAPIWASDIGRNGASRRA